MFKHTIVGIVVVLYAKLGARLPAMDCLESSSSVALEHVICYADLYANLLDGNLI